jgi:hypothetical protein
MLLWLCRTFFRRRDSGDVHREDWALFQGHSRRSMTHLQLWPVRKCGSLLKVPSRSCATSAWNSCSCDKSRRTNFATVWFMPRSSVKISLCGIPRSSSNSHTQLPIFVDCNIQHLRVFCLLQAFWNVDCIPSILGRLWIIGTKLLFGLHSLNHP